MEKENIFRRRDDKRRRKRRIISRKGKYVFTEDKQNREVLILGQ